MMKSGKSGLDSGAISFSNGDLLRLFLPLIVEQFLEYVVGLSDSIMVSHAGEAAVSGVSLVDFVMALLISIFAALSTGGAVVAGQYLGGKNIKKANDTVNQLVWFTGAVSLAVMVAVYCLKDVILRGLFGNISAEVYMHANTYLLFVAGSIPSIALYSACAAVFRSMGNSRLPMNIMILMNILHIGLNALLVYGLGMGTEGVAVSSLVSRIGAAVILLIYCLDSERLLHVSRTLHHRFDGETIQKILGIGLPYGFENGMFYLGRLLILSLVASFGTAAIAANAVSGTIVMFQVLPGMAIGLGMTVVISRCVGAGDYSQAKRYTEKIMSIIYLVHIFSTIAVLAILPLIIKIYGLSSDASYWTNRLVWSHGIVMVLIWPFAYTLPVTFRAAGDAKFPMLVSMLSMLLCRIALSYVFGVWFRMGMYGTWVAMFVDWFVKAGIFAWRYGSGKWIRHSTV